MSKKVLLTGDRPTGPLHLGHYVGSLKKRLDLQRDLETYVMIADAQAITDNFKDINKVKTNIFEVACDYLAVGIDPAKCSIFIQSQLSELPELAMYFLNLVTIQRIGHNPTVKQEVKSRGFKEGVPAGFYLYPMFQVADITAFQANVVPVGPDQAPMIELTRDIVRKFNDLYKTDALIMPEAIFPQGEKTLPGLDGQKISKSLKGRKFSNIHKKNLSKAKKESSYLMKGDKNVMAIPEIREKHYNILQTKEYREKVSRGVRNSNRWTPEKKEEHRKRQRDRLKKNNPSSKPVVIDGVFYASIQDAITNTGFTRNYIKKNYLTK